MSGHSTRSSKLSRRTFAKAAAAGIAGSQLLVEGRGSNSRVTREILSAQQETKEAPPLVVAYLELVRARYGKFLNEEQIESLKRDFEGKIRSSERLAASKLSNADEPDFVFYA